MKKTITLLLIFMGFTINAQVYKGKDDLKLQIGANFQEGANGINIVTDLGLGENISYGFSAVYLLSSGDSDKFEDKFDLRARFNANIGNVFKIQDKMDIYPGLDIGLRNFGAHLGLRYFFTQGFGIYSEAGVPIAKFNTTPVGPENFNNQFTFNIGACFDL